MDLSGEEAAVEGPRKPSGCAWEANDGRECSHFCEYDSVWGIWRHMSHSSGVKENGVTYVYILSAKQWIEDTEMMEVLKATGGYVGAHCAALSHEHNPTTGP